jgi:hypothetical protein
MMTCEIFERFADLAVPEPVIADTELPTALSESERGLYRDLLKRPRGRLEQEFLPEELSRAAILIWAEDYRKRNN